MNKPHILIFLAVAGFCGCGSAAVPPATVRNPTGWSTAVLVGWKYTGESETSITSSYFDPDGMNPVTIISKGKSSSKDDPNGAPSDPMFPMFYWSIDRDGVLLISKSERPEDAFQRWELVSLEDSSANVLINGKSMKLKRTRD